MSIRKQGQEDMSLQAPHSNAGSGRVSGFQKYHPEPHPRVRGRFERHLQDFYASLSSGEKLKLAGASHIVLLSSWKN